MFGKIKNRLKDVFTKSEEVIDEGLEEDVNNNEGEETRDEGMEKGENESLEVPKFEDSIISDDNNNEENEDEGIESEEDKDESDNDGEELEDSDSDEKGEHLDEGSKLDENSEEDLLTDDDGSSRVDEEKEGEPEDSSDKEKEVGEDDGIEIGEDESIDNGDGRSESAEEDETKEDEESSESDDKVEEENILEEVGEEKKGFFGRVFSRKKKEEIEVSELEEVEDDMLEDVSEDEIEAIKGREDLPEEEVLENVEKVEESIEREEELEKEVVSDIDENNKLTEDDSLEDVKEAAEREVSELDLVDEKANDKDNESDKEKTGFLGKTFSKLKSKTVSDDDFDKIWAELSIFLLEINIAFEIVEKIEKHLRSELIGNSFNRFGISEKIRNVLEDEVYEVLKSREENFLTRIQEVQKNGEPVKILVLGVNGTGKTTTIAKIVHFLKKNDLSVCVAAADTFRAAAIEQLEEHSKKLKFKLIMHKGGSDPAAVAFDAISHAKAKKVDVVLVDTAGRMPNNSNLMMELQKVDRVSKSDLVVFVGDSVSGNDLIDQIELFDKGCKIDGVILTKIDTDEKPGSIVTAAYAIEKPIFYLGVGQTYDDLVEFDAKEISKKLFELDDEE